MYVYISMYVRNYVRMYLNVCCMYVVVYVCMSLNARAHAHTFVVRAGYRSHETFKSSIYEQIYLISFARLHGRSIHSALSPFYFFYLSTSLRSCRILSLSPTLPLSICPYTCLFFTLNLSVVT